MFECKPHVSYFILYVCSTMLRRSTVRGSMAEHRRMRECTFCIVSNTIPLCRPSSSPKLVTWPLICLMQTSSSRSPPISAPVGRRRSAWGASCGPNRAPFRVNSTLSSTRSCRPIRRRCTTLSKGNKEFPQKPYESMCVYEQFDRM